MSALETLRFEYPGDDAWAAYAAVFAPPADAIDPDMARMLVPQDEELASTLIGIMGRAEASAWIDRSIPALDAMSPAQVIATLPGGCRIVRHLVMRMPV